MFFEDLSEKWSYRTRPLSIFFFKSAIVILELSNSSWCPKFFNFRYNSSGVLRFVKCQPPSSIIFKLFFFIFEKYVSNLQNEYSLFFKFLKSEKDVKYFFLQALDPYQGTKS